MNRTKEFKIIKFNNNLIEETVDSIIAEKVQNIFVNREFYASLMCTPSEIKELAAGFLFSEGIISSRDCIVVMEELSENILCVMLKNETDIDTNRVKTLTSGCGGGRIDIDFLEENRIKPISSTSKINAFDILMFMKDFNGRSELFKETGGVHSCAICDSSGILKFSEDIGRHNALDKVIGKALLEGMSFRDKLIMTTGRISSDIVVKTAKAGIPILVSHSAPTDMAINIAKAAGMTILGFTRGKRLNIYCGAERIIL